jgi:hypothetical protein
MPRKTSGTGTSSRSKKTAVQPAAMQVASEIPQNGKLAKVVPVHLNPNLEEEIRRRAYELYLERRATAGSENGDENQDWLIAEREIRSRHGGQEQQTA